ncbi:MAG: DoxX family protein, partial [Gammaproteobacteria bacterium]
MEKIFWIWTLITDKLEQVGEWLPQLALRILLAWEFWESGVEKFNGNNWFAHIKDNFPFPFNHVPVELSWFISTWSELVGSLMLLVGLFTRFWSLSLIILSIVAIAAVHWPESYGSIGELLKGYAITDKGFGNYKLPLIYIILLVPLLLNGAGKASVDYWLKRYVTK